MLRLLKIFCALGFPSGGRLFGAFAWALTWEASVNASDGQEQRGNSFAKISTASCNSEVTRGWRFIKMPENLFAQCRFCSGIDAAFCSRLCTRLLRRSLSHCRRPYRAARGWTGVADVRLHCFSALCRCVRYLLLRIWMSTSMVSWQNTALCQQRRGKDPNVDDLHKKNVSLLAFFCVEFTYRGGNLATGSRRWQGKWRPRRPPAVSEMPQLTVSCLLCLGGLSSCLYIVFSQSCAFTGATLGFVYPSVNMFSALFIVLD